MTLHVHCFTVFKILFENCIFNGNFIQTLYAQLAMNSQKKQHKIVNYETEKKIETNWEIPIKMDF